MHCITVILTSLISQGLLQVVLDKEERDFTGWFFQYEFSNLPVSAAWSSREAQQHFLQCQCQCHNRLATTGTTTTAEGIHYKRHWRSHRHTRFLPGWLFGNHSVSGTGIAKAWASRKALAYQFDTRLPSLAICSRFRCQHPWLFF
jgi:hypothetical protein